MAGKSVLINAPDLARRLGEPHPPVLVDVRHEEDFSAAHIPGATNHCVFEVVFLDRLGTVAPDRQAVVCVYGVSEDSYEARVAAEKLCRTGYSQVIELREGFEGWMSAGLPVEGRGSLRTVEPSAPDGWRDIDVSESRVEWLGRNLLNKHYGRIALKGGKLCFDDGRLRGGEFTFDMHTITCDDLAGSPLHDVLVAHLLSDDFFDAELYPEASFIIETAEPVSGATPGSPNLAVRGTLTLKNVSRPLEFIAVSGISPDGKPAAQAAFSIDRTQWNVLYGSGRYFRRLGGHLVNDLIEFQVRILTT